MVYVLNKDKKPLMPTERNGHVRRMLKDGLAKVVKRTPFTIQLTYDTHGFTQGIDLGVDSGSGTIGVAAANTSKVYYLANVKLRNDIVKLLADRKELRSARRRRLRYRKKRYSNRVKSKHKGWLPPSIENKINTHINEVLMAASILPITSITIETASFDIQKIKSENESNEKYQECEQTKFWNVREYVMFRDGHICQCCGGKSHDKILNVHHIESRKTGGNSPNNLITLCKTCHIGYHNKTIKLPDKIKRGMKFNDKAFMGIMRWKLLDRLKDIFEPIGIPVNNMYGYKTKIIRQENKLKKEHYIDALCISGHPESKLIDIYYIKQKVRCHNRQIHKCKILKGGKKRLNQSPYVTNGFRLFDRVMYMNKEYYIFSRRRDGRFEIGSIDGSKITIGKSDAKHLKLLEIRKTVLIERRSI